MASIVDDDPLSPRAFHDVVRLSRKWESRVALSTLHCVEWVAAK